jgi:hypothetical protein
MKDEMKDEKPMSTADMVRATDEARERREDEVRERPEDERQRREDELRGVGDEHIVGGPSAVEAPPAAVERNAPARDNRSADRAEPSRPAVRDEPNAPLFAERDADGLRRQWSEIQAAFVDEPRKAVERADALVADAMKRLAEMFAGERQGLEQQWDRGGNVTTEDLRIVLQRYRSFFDRLLSV